MLLNVIIFSLVLLCSCLRGMEQLPECTQVAKTIILPGDIIRKIASFIPGSANWSDTQQAFTLQSLACVNSHWHLAMNGLSSREFPYHSF